MHPFRLRFLLPWLCLLQAGCESAPGADERRALSIRRRVDELSRRNPVRKGRYNCWQITAVGDRLAPELFILSDNMYQIDEVTGEYGWDQSTKSLAWISGPLYSDSARRTGIFQPKGTPTASGVPRPASIIQVYETNSAEPNVKRKILHCDCLELE